MTYLWAYLAVMNLAAFCSFGVDKRRARRKLWRIPERTLLLLALFGGSLGAVAGMLFFRHKTKHWYFRYLLPVFLAAHLAALWWLCF